MGCPFSIINVFNRQLFSFYAVIFLINCIQAKFCVLHIHLNYRKITMLKIIMFDKKSKTR